MYIKRTLADPEFSNLCDFSSFPQLYSEVGTITNGIFISNQSLDVITKTGDYTGNNIPELIPYVGSSAWCIIRAHVQSDNAASLDVITNVGSIINIYRESDGTYKIYPLALKSETLTFRGIFEGNLNDAASWKILAGIYQIQGKDTISNGPDGAQWCLFIQFPDDYHNQIMCIGGDNGVVTRRCIGSPQVWSSWT